MYFIIISLGMGTKMRVLGISSYAALPREGSNGRAGARPSQLNGANWESRHLGGALEQRASCPLRQRRNRNRLRTAASLAASTAALAATEKKTELVPGSGIV